MRVRLGLGLGWRRWIGGPLRRDGAAHRGGFAAVALALAATVTSAGLPGRKGDMWEGGIRVPAVIEWPARIRRPIVTEVPADVVDIYPTIVDVLKVRIPNQVEPLDGVSLLPLMEGQVKERPKPLGFWQSDGSREMTTDSGPSA